MIKAILYPLAPINLQNEYSHTGEPRKQEKKKLPSRPKEPQEHNKLLLLMVLSYQCKEQWKAEELFNWPN